MSCLHVTVDLISSIRCACFHPLGMASVLTPIRATLNQLNMTIKERLLLLLLQLHATARAATPQTGVHFNAGTQHLRRSMPESGCLPDVELDSAEKKI